MKQIIKNYTFNKATGQVTFTDFTTIDRERILLITNLTAGIIIYRFDSSSLGGTVSTNVLTLTYNTSAMTNSDKLQIFYDALSNDPVYDTPIFPGNSNAPQLLQSGLASLLTDYMRQNPKRKYQLVYQDDFNLGFQGWQYQYDVITPGKNGLTLTTEARLANYGLELHTSGIGGAACWARKGFRLPTNLKKIIFGCYWTQHAEDGNNPGRVTFDCDIQYGDGTGTVPLQRYYFSLRYYNWDVPSATLVQKWQVNDGNATSGQNFTDVTNGHMPIPFNEQYKPMPSDMMVVFDLENKKYECLYSNGNYYDLSAMDGPDASTTLTNPFDMGLVNIIKVENRSNSDKEANMIVERPFMVWVF